MRARRDAEWREVENRFIQAHATAAWTGFAKPPDLQPFLEKLRADRQPQREMTEDEILSAWGAWSAVAAAQSGAAAPS